MTLEANQDSVLYSVGAAFTRLENVIRLDLYAAESVTDTAVAMGGDQ